MKEPRYVHDCDACVFLGHQEGQDVYYCRQGGAIDTIIFRYGNDGPEYGSGWWMNNRLRAPLAAALVEAMAGK